MTTFVDRAVAGARRSVASVGLAGVARSGTALQERAEPPLDERQPAPAGTEQPRFEALWSALQRAREDLRADNGGGQRGDTQDERDGWSSFTAQESTAAEARALGETSQAGSWGGGSSSSADATRAGSGDETGSPAEAAGRAPARDAAKLLAGVTWEVGTARPSRSMVAEARLSRGAGLAREGDLVRALAGTHVSGDSSAQPGPERHERDEAQGAGGATPGTHHESPAAQAVTRAHTIAAAAHDRGASPDTTSRGNATVAVSRNLHPSGKDASTGGGHIVRASAVGGPSANPSLPAGAVASHLPRPTPAVVLSTPSAPSPPAGSPPTRRGPSLQIDQLDVQVVSVASERPSPPPAFAPGHAQTARPHSARGAWQWRSRYFVGGGGR